MPSTQRLAAYSHLFPEQWTSKNILLLLWAKNMMNRLFEWSWKGGVCKSYQLKPVYLRFQYLAPLIFLIYTIFLDQSPSNKSIYFFYQCNPLTHYSTCCPSFLCIDFGKKTTLKAIINNTWSGLICIKLQKVENVIYLRTVFSLAFVKQKHRERVSKSGYHL